MRHWIVCMVTAAILLPAPMASAAQGAENSIIILGGRITKVEGNTVTVRDKSGKESVIQAKAIDFGPSGGKVKAGDVLDIRNGVISKAK